MNNLLNRAEQAAVAEISAAYRKLSPLAQAEAAKAVSWAERHFGASVTGAFAAGVLFCWFITTVL